MKIALRFVEGTLAGQIKEAFLYDKKHVLVGRDPSANIVLPEQDRTASTTHAKIVFEKGEVWINDVGSHYGTFVNHKPTPRSKIKHGDFIRFGAKGPLAEFLVVPDGQTIATPVQKPAAPAERSAQSPSGAPISKRPKPAATRMMAAPTPEMLALLAGDVASNVAAATGAPMPPAAPAAPHAFPAPSRAPATGKGPGGGYGEPVVVLGPRGGGGAPPIPMPMPVPMPRPQPVPPPEAAPMPAEPAGRPPRGGKTQVGMSAMMNPAMRRRLEQQGKLPDEVEAGLPPQGAPHLPTYGDAGAPGYVLGDPPPQAQPMPMPMPYPGPAPAPYPGPAPVPPPVDDTKECPFCAERIKKAALKCRFCGEFLTTTQNKANDPDAPPVMDERMFAMPKDARGPSVAALPPPSAPGAAPSPAFPPAPQAQRAPAPASWTPPPAAAAATWAPPPAAAPSPPPTPSGAAPTEPDEAPHWDLPSLDDDEPAPGAPGQGG